MSKNGKRIYGLDYMRGMACLLVVLYHYTTRLVELFPEVECDWLIKVPFGYMGVSVFFLLSGYLSLRHYKEETTPWQYIKSKVKRLYPCYWCAVILTFCTTSLLLRERSVPLKSFLVNLTMLESFLGVAPVDGAYWTLANELIFYFFIFVFFVVIKKRSKFTQLAIGWLLIANFILSFANNSMLFLLGNKLFMAQYAHMFLAGGLIYSAFTEKNRNLHIIGLALCIFTQFRVFPIGYSLFFLAAIGLIIFFTITENKKTSENHRQICILKPLVFLASISYPLYLVHQNIGYVFIVNLYRAGIKNEMIILIPIIVLSTLSYLMHVFIEVPISKSRR